MPKKITTKSKNKKALTAKNEKNKKNKKNEKQILPLEKTIKKNTKKPKNIIRETAPITMKNHKGKKIQIGLKELIFQKEPYFSIETVSRGYVIKNGKIEPLF
jgi:hypothetical protein